MKKILAALLLGAALAMTALPVSAQGVDSTVTMTANGDTAAVKLNLPENSAQGVKALSLSFQVDSSEPVDAEFVFAQSLPGTVQEYRYDADTGLMNVYVAGRDDLLPTGTADLGSIRVDVSQAGSAKVRLVEDSLQLVNGALGTTATTTSTNGEFELVQPSVSDSVNPAPESSARPSDTVTVTSDSVSSVQPDSAQTEVVLTSPTAAPAGGQTGGNSSSGSANGSSAETQQTPEPDSSPAPESSAAPAEDGQAPAATASPEQGQTAPESAPGLPLVPILVVAALAAAGIIGVAVIRFRG